MQDKMMKLLMSKKKEGKELSDSDQKAKMQALNGMKDMANEMMGERLKGLKKVTVASDSKAGLDAGLTKAQDLLEEESEEEPAADLGMSPADAEKEGEEKDHVEQILEMCEDYSPEQIESLIAKLQEKLQSKKEM